MTRLLLSENTAIKLFGFGILSSFLYHHQDCRSDPYWIPIWFLVQETLLNPEEDWSQILCIIIFLSSYVVLVLVYYSRRSSRLLLIWNSWHSHFFSRPSRIWSHNYILYNWVRTIMMYGSGSPSRQLCVPFFVSISFLDALFILCHKSFSRYRFEAAS